MLGGVAIDHPTGLAGHPMATSSPTRSWTRSSGPFALGDLGTHFPSDDPAYAGAGQPAAPRTGRDAGQRGGIPDRLGGRVGHRASAAVGTAPRGQRDRPSRALGIERDAVSVKATTNDGLGIVGAGEAIATLATVIVEKSGALTDLPAKPNRQGAATA